MNAQFHLFQDLTNLFFVVIVLEKINQRIQEMIDIPEMIEVQEIEVQDIPEMTEVHEMTVEMNLQL